MISGIISSKKSVLRFYLQAAHNLGDSLCELMYQDSTSTCNKEIDYYTANHGLDKLTITYFNPALSYTGSPGFFIPNDTIVEKLTAACDVLFWQNNPMEPLKIIKDSSNLSPDIMTKWDAHIQDHS